MKKLGVRRVHLVMHDLGGMWSLESSIRNPASLKSVVVIDSGVLIDYIGHPLAAAYVTPLVGEATMAATTRPSFTASIQGQNPKPLWASFVDRMYDFMDRRTRCAILPYYRDIKDPDAVGRRQAAVLRKRRRPALVVWGEQDPYIPKYVAYKQRQAFPGARVEIIPNAGHWPFIDYPGRVERLVVPFLRDALRRGGGGSSPGGGSGAGGGSRSGGDCGGRPATITGTSGDDELTGAPEGDVIVAGAGRDLVRAGDGADVVCAGSGDDRVGGGPGGDRLDGSTGNDRLDGDDGADRLLGASGRDRCVGGGGADRVTDCEE